MNESTQENGRLSSFQEPNANSTLIDAPVNSPLSQTPSPRSFTENSARYSAAMNSSVHFQNPSTDNSNSVGHISHIPRTPPSPATYTIPSVISQAIGTDIHTEELFGMIKLQENDVCYTSGTIEWVGKKRSFPINSGFKIINENHKILTEPAIKRVKTLNKTFTSGRIDKIEECNCADVLPTVNAIVDHLNALHEAVDLVDLRLNTLEDTLSKD